MKQKLFTRLASIFPILGWASVAILCVWIWLFAVGRPVEKSVHPEQINPETGFAYTYTLSELQKKLFWVPYDEVGMSDPSQLTLFENGTQLLPNHTPHDRIRQQGKGGYSHWGSALYFSSSDNSDPRSNGRTYIIRASYHLKPAVFWFPSACILAVAWVFFRLSPRSYRPWIMAGRIMSQRLVGVLIAVLLIVALICTYWGIGRKLTFPPSQILKGAGYSYSVVLPPIFDGSLGKLFRSDGDKNGAANGSPTRFFENEVESKAGHLQHTDIITLGSGRFSHWEDSIVFSSLDNSDAHTNGRTYRAEVRYLLDPRMPLGLVLGLLLVIALRAFQEGRSRTLIISALLLGISTFVLQYSHGFLFWLNLGFLGGAGVGLLGSIAFLLVLPATKKLVSTLTTQILILVGTTFLCLAVGELGLVGYEYLGRWGIKLPDLKMLLANANSTADPRASRRWEYKTVSANDPTDLEREISKVKGFVNECSAEARSARESRQGLLALPPEWQRRFVSVEGAAVAYYWHNVLHVESNDHFRRTTPFPAKRDNVFRIMAVGDSLTYGQGIPDELTYPAVLERLLSKDYHVEVLNLGACGYQSEDVLDVINGFAPDLRPNLIIYGMCLNDFLPSGIGEGEPPPFKIPPLLLDRTRIGQLADQAVKSLAIRFGYAKDFFGQVYDGIDGYHARFTRDVEAMNESNRSLNLPPIVSLVLTQLPAASGPGYGLSHRAEQSFRQAGFNLIESEPYFQVLDGQNFQVSPWEGHPDEAINDLYARLLADRISHLEILKKFRKD